MVLIALALPAQHQQRHALFAATCLQHPHQLPHMPLPSVPGVGAHGADEPAGQAIPCAQTHWHGFQRRCGDDAPLLPGHGVEMGVARLPVYGGVKAGEIRGRVRHAEDHVGQVQQLLLVACLRKAIGCHAASLCCQAVYEYSAPAAHWKAVITRRPPHLLLWHFWLS